MLRICIILASILIISVSTIPAIQTSAQSDPITVKHWFFTSYKDGCSSGNEKSLKFYQSLTSQYLAKYDFQGTLSASECIRVVDIQNNIDQFVTTATAYDLPIVILDGFSGLDYALDTSTLGHYQFQGNDRIIVFASLSPFIESDTGAWILGHELAHFALHYKNYPVSTYANWVHTTESTARDCIGDDLSLNYCPELWTTVKAPSGKLIKMMAVYDSNSSALDDLPASIDNSPTQIQPINDSYQCFGHYLSKEFNQAITCYNIFLISNASDTDAMSFLGRSFEGISDYNSALSIFQKINRLEPNNTVGLNGIARNYDSLDQCEKSIPYYEKTLLIDPKDIEAKTFINLLSLVCPSNPLVSESPNTFDIKPLFTNGFIEDYIIDPKYSSLILDVKTENFKSGEMQLVLPRDLIDAKSGLTDDVFFVLIDGHETDYDETYDMFERTIRFSVPAGTDNIEIFGTTVAANAQVIPEFQEIAIMILVAGIVGIISISKKLLKN